MEPSQRSEQQLLQRRGHPKRCVAQVPAPGTSSTTSVTNCHSYVNKILVVCCQGSCSPKFYGSDRERTRVKEGSRRCSCASIRSGNSDRMTQQLWSGARPTVMPMDAYRHGDEF